MNELFRRNLRRSLAAHGLALLLIVVVPFILDCRARRKPPEIVTFIDLQVSIPPPPAPEAEPEPEVQKPPPPELPKDIPEPQKETPKPKPEPPKPKPVIQKSTNRVARPLPPAPPPKDKPLSEAEIRKLLALGARVSDRTVAPPDDVALASYYLYIRQVMYQAWQQPSQLRDLPGLSATVMIRVERNGSISRCTLSRPSGNSVMDASVMKAAKSVSRLNALPAQFDGTFKDITIDFELTDAGL